MKKGFMKKLIVVLCVVLAAVTISATSIMATVAYLTSSAAVSNVFTIGNVGISMTESKVNPNGTLSADGGRVDTNTYHLVPNTTYIKDPTIFVNAGSEDSFLFVLVRNDIEGIECKDATHTASTDPQLGHRGTIADQLAANGWAKYRYAASGWVYVYVGIGNVPDGDATRTTTSSPSYVYAGNGLLANSKTSNIKQGDAFKQDGSFKLFDEFTIAANAVTTAYGGAKITLTAFAIQGSGFNNSLAEAWTAVTQTYPYIHGGTDN